MNNFSLGSERFLPRWFLMWWFHFALEFLCAGEGCSSFSPKPAAKSQRQLRWEENLSERGGILGLRCQEQKEQLGFMEICSDLWMGFEQGGALLIHRKQRGKCSCGSHCCLSWGSVHVLRAEFTQVFPSHPYSNTCYLCFDLLHGWSSKKTCILQLPFSAPLSLLPLSGGCQDNYRHCY